QGFERRDGHEDAAAWSQNLRCAAQKLVGSLYVLQDVEHQNQIERRRGLVRAIEVPDGNAAPPLAASFDRRSVRLNALHVTERFERVEEQRCAAANVEDTCFRDGRTNVA